MIAVYIKVGINQAIKMATKARCKSKLNIRLDVKSIGNRNEFCKIAAAGNKINYKRMMRGE